MATEFQHKKHVKVVVDLDVGEKVLLSGFSKEYDGIRRIELFDFRQKNCESGVMVKLEGIETMFDSGWLQKII